MVLTRGRGCLGGSRRSDACREVHYATTTFFDEWKLPESLFV
jgi:hypothetical protein